MKSKILIFGCLLNFSVSAQKIVADKRDDFDKSRMITTSEETIRGPMKYCTVKGFIGAETSDTVYALLFSVRSPAVTSIDENSNIYLKMQSGDVLQFKNRGKFDVVGTDDYLVSVINLTEEDMKKIASGKVSKIRFDTSKVNIDVEVEEKKQGAIPGVVSLISSYKL